MARRLTRQGRARKAQLLDCAASLFAERGYQQTRVIDIVKAAGVAKGLFYWYFDNKDALFRELIGDMRRRLRVVQEEALEGVRTPLGQLYAGTRASVQFMAEHRELYALMQIEGQTGETFTDELRRTTVVHASDTATVIEAGQRAGLMRDDDDPLHLAWGVLGTLLHLVYFHRTERMQVPAAALGDIVARFVTHAIAASDELAAQAEAEVTGGPMAALGH